MKLNDTGNNYFCQSFPRKIDVPAQGYFRSIVAVMFSMIAVLALLSGCAVKPDIPPGMSARDVIGAIDSRTASIRDFTGTALVQVKSSDGASQSVRLSVRYRSPDRFRILAKAFAGIPVALLTADTDSVTVFFSSENTYMKVGRHDELLRYALPGIGIGFDRLAGVLTGTLPPPEVRDNYRISLDSTSGPAVVTLDDGTTKHRLIVEGKKLRVVAETIERFNRVVFRRTASRFRENNGIDFPGRIILENERGMVEMDFSDCTINGGVSDDDLTFSVPRGAVRLDASNLTGAL